MKSFKEKYIVVTGAGSGLGRAIAIQLANEGAYLALLGRTLSNLEETSRLITGVPPVLLPTDLCHAKNIESSCKAIKELFPKVDILINNAAGWHLGILEDMSNEEIEGLVASTVTGSIFMTKFLLSHLAIATAPHVLNVLSTAGLPKHNIDSSIASVPYFAAKWGQAGFSEALRDELKSKGIKVTSLYPGGFTREPKPGGKELNLDDVVEAIQFCLSRPKTVSIDALTITSASL